jgi:glycosyltransferase involved in cell wall biosynthesis
MKILHVVNIDFTIPYYFGGQFCYMKNFGIQTSVACTSSNLLDSYGADYCFIPHHIPIKRQISPLSDIRSILLLYRLIRSEKYGMVFGHTPKGALLAMCASFLAQTPKRVYVRHGIMLETSAGFLRLILLFIERFTAYLSTTILCVSKSVLNRSAELKLGGSVKSMTLSHYSINGVDTNRFSPEAFNATFVSSFKEYLGIKQEKIVVGFIGRISNDKGIPDLIAAWKKIITQQPQLQLLVIGIFDDRDQVSEDVANYIQQSSTITWVPYTREIAQYYSVIDILVLPSYREGMPTVVMEASSMAKPVITTRATGCIDSIKENQTGIFVNHSADSIAEAILYYFQNPDIRKIHGQNGRSFVLSNFKRELIWDQLLNNLILSTSN